MANWWDNGLQGKTGTPNLGTSSSPVPIGAYYDILSPRVIGSVVLRENNDYTQLLYTSASGTQIFARIRYTVTENVQVYRPDEIVNVRNYGISLQLHKPGTTADFGIGAGIGTIIAGTSDLQQWWLRNGAVEPSSLYDPSKAYPRTGSGNVQSLVVLSSDAGLEFWVVGFGGYWDAMNYKFTAPATKVGTLPTSYLNNTFWFDPSKDFLPKDERDTSGDDDDFNRDKIIDYDYDADDIGFSELPNNGVMGLGYYKLFVPSNAQLTSAFDILWTEGVGEWWEVLSKIFYKPDQFIVSLMMFPFAPATSGTAEIMFGMYPTGVHAATVASQWVYVDCGYLDVPMKYGSVLDYSPHEKIQIFLPFIGVRDISVDQCSGGRIAVRYNIDLLTGSACAEVRVHNTGSSNSVLYTFDCNIAIQVPITSNNYSQLFDSLLRMGTTMAIKDAKGIYTTAGEITGATSEYAHSMSGEVCQTGHLSSNVGMLGRFKPYLILEHPVQSLPAGYASYNGFPSNITSTLSGLSGYTVIESIHLEIPGATEEELRDIEYFLHNGVVL